MWNVHDVKDKNANMVGKSEEDWRFRFLEKVVVHGASEG